MSNEAILQVCYSYGILQNRCAAYKFVIETKDYYLSELEYRKDPYAHRVGLLYEFRANRTNYSRKTCVTAAQGHVGSMELSQTVCKLV